MYIKRVAERLDTLSRDPYMRPIPCCVVGFPRGAGTAESIASSSLEIRDFSPSSYFLNNLTPSEAAEAIANGALEIDLAFPGLTHGSHSAEALWCVASHA